MLKKSLLPFLLIFLIASTSYSDIPPLINYQGYLTDGSGNPLNAPVNAPVSIQFKIYDSENNGKILWSETQSVAVDDGIFSVLLGTVTPIPYSVFDGNDRYFTLQVESDSEMRPRKRLVSVGYSFHAYNSEKLNGKEDSSFVQTVDGVSPNSRGNVDLVAGSNITLTPDDINNQITISATSGSGGDNLGDHTATQNIKLNGHQLSGDGEDEGIYVDNDGNVGIGKTHPREILDVEGNIVTSGDIIVDSTTYRGNSINIESEKTFSIGNTLHVRDRRLGITVTNPQAKLHLNGIPGVDGIMFPDGTLQTTAADTSLLNIFTISEAGNVGIGTSAPIYELEVANLTAGDGVESAVTANDAGGAIAAYSSTLPDPFTHYAGRVSLFANAVTMGLDLRADAINGDMRFYTGGFLSPNERMRITKTGYVGIGTGSPNFKLDVRGTIGNNTTLYHSDIRWKKNIKTLDHALETTLALRGVQFEWRRDEFPEMNFSRGKRIGLIAQEVETVIPELVATGKDGYKLVEYTNLVALLIEAVKEQQKEIELLKSQTVQLTNSLHKIEKILIQDEKFSTVAASKNEMTASLK